VNPFFIQFIDQDGKLIEKSPNLKNKTLSFDPKHVSNVLYDDVLANSAIRQMQVPFTINLKLLVI
jgi:hypothetical protein